VEQVSPHCPPICAQVGHDFVTLTIWRCRHHQQLTAHLSAYQDIAPDPVVRLDSEWLSGPFTADIDITNLLERLQLAIAVHLLD